MNNFKNDIEFENGMSTIVDKFYKKIWGQDIEINKLFTTNNSDIDRIKDQEMGIDKEIKFPKRCKITVQEKSRRFKYDSMQDLTIEYMSNTKNNTKGEFFHLYAQYYTYVKAGNNDKSVESIHIFRVPELMEFINSLDDFDFVNYIRQNKGYSNNGHSNASFLAIPFSIIPKNCIYKKWTRSGGFENE